MGIGARKAPRHLPVELLKVSPGILIFRICLKLLFTPADGIQDARVGQFGPQAVDVFKRRRGQQDPTAVLDQCAEGGGADIIIFPSLKCRKRV